MSGIARPFEPIGRIAAKAGEETADVQAALSDLVLEAGWSYDDVTEWALALSPGASVIEAVDDIINRRTP